jgi:hypothetical protein
MVQLPHKVKGNVGKSKPQYGLAQSDRSCGRRSQARLWPAYGPLVTNGHGIH